MSFASWISIAAFAALPLTAIAQQNQLPADPADAQAAVPAPVYTSAMQDYQNVQDHTDSPDQVWRTANQEMAALGGHAGHISERATRPSTPSARQPASSAASHAAHQTGE